MGVVLEAGEFVVTVEADVLLVGCVWDVYDFVCGVSFGGGGGGGGGVFWGAE